MALNPNAVVGLSTVPVPSEGQYRFGKAGTAPELGQQIERVRAAIVAAFPDARLVSFDVMGGGTGAAFVCRLGFNTDGVAASDLPLVSDCIFAFAEARESAELLSETNRLIVAARALGLFLFGQGGAGGGAGVRFMIGYAFATLVPVPDSTIVEELEYIPQLEQGWIGQTSEPAQATLAGASFILPRPVQMNRIILRVSSFVAPATGVLFIYQESRGRVADSLSLVASVSFVPAASTTFILTPVEGDVLLSDGFFYALWGQDSGAGSYNLRVYNISSTDLVNNFTEVGTHPTVATSLLDPAAPPATINPLVGGDLSNENTEDVSPIIRFVNV